jgi:hypothetical protein
MRACYVGKKFYGSLSGLSSRRKKSVDSEEHGNMVRPTKEDASPKMHNPKLAFMEEDALTDREMPVTNCFEEIPGYTLDDF